MDSSANSTDLVRAKAIESLADYPEVREAAETLEHLAHDKSAFSDAQLFMRGRAVLALRMLRSGEGYAGVEMNDRAYMTAKLDR
jgi:hypothetical protein